jgi:5'-3' exonuclease
MDAERMDRIVRAARGVSAEQVSKIMSKLAEFGIRCYTAVEEADFALGWMSRHGVVDFVIGDDADLLVGGCTLVRGMTKLVSSGTPANVFVPSDILDHLKISRRQFRQFACLAACDYVPKIPKIGPSKAIQVIRKHGTVSAFVHSWGDKERKRYSLPSPVDEYCSKVERACALLGGAHCPDEAALRATFGRRLRAAVVS